MTPTADSDGTWRKNRKTRSPANHCPGRRAFILRVRPRLARVHPPKQSILKTRRRSEFYINAARRQNCVD